LSGCFCSNIELKIRNSFNNEFGRMGIVGVVVMVGAFGNSRREAGSYIVEWLWKI